MKRNLTAILIRIFLIAKDVEHFFKCLLAIPTTTTTTSSRCCGNFKTSSCCAVQTGLQLSMRPRLVLNLVPRILFSSFSLSFSLEESEEVSRETSGMSYSFKSPKGWGAVSLGIGLPGMFWWSAATLANTSFSWASGRECGSPAASQEKAGKEISQLS